MNINELTLIKSFKFTINFLDNSNIKDKIIEIEFNNLFVVVFALIIFIAIPIYSNLQSALVKKVFGNLINQIINFDVVSFKLYYHFSNFFEFRDFAEVFDNIYYKYKKNYICRLIAYNMHTKNQNKQFTISWEASTKVHQLMLSQNILRFTHTLLKRTGLTNHRWGLVYSTGNIKESERYSGFEFQKIFKSKIINIIKSSKISITQKDNILARYNQFILIENMGWLFIGQISGAKAYLLMMSLGAIAGSIYNKSTYNDLIEIITTVVVKQYPSKEYMTEAEFEKFKSSVLYLTHCIETFKFLNTKFNEFELGYKIESQLLDNSTNTLDSRYCNTGFLKIFATQILSQLNNI